MVGSPREQAVDELGEVDGQQSAEALAKLNEMRGNMSGF